MRLGLQAGAASGTGPRAAKRPRQSRGAFGTRGPVPLVYAGGLSVGRLGDGERLAEGDVVEDLHDAGWPGDFDLADGGGIVCVWFEFGPFLEQGDGAVGVQPQDQRRVTIVTVQADATLIDKQEVDLDVVGDVEIDEAVSGDVGDCHTEPLVAGAE